MDETTPLDRALLRALRRRSAHAYALAQESSADRATVYRRLAALERAGLVASKREAGRGAQRKVLRLTPSGHEALRAELREAMRLLLGSLDAGPRGGGGARSDVRAPVVFVTGSRASAIERRIVRALARAHPRATHVVVPPGSDVADAGVPTIEAPWAALPFRDAYARTMFVNELPPDRALDRAAAEWARVLASGGQLNVVAPAPLPRGIHPLVDRLAELQDELFPDQRGAPAPERVTLALDRAVGRPRRAQAGDQNVWTVRRR